MSGGIAPSHYKTKMHMDAHFPSKIHATCDLSMGWTRLSKKQTNLRHRNVVSSLNKVADARDESLVTLFSLSNSAVLALFSAECLRGMENAQPEVKVRHSGPVTQKSLLLIAAVMIAPFSHYFTRIDSDSNTEGGFENIIPKFSSGGTQESWTEGLDWHL